MSKTLIIAFRGASQTAPENTVPAIQKALKAGADAIALDVQGSKDDVPLVIADQKLERTTNGTGRVSQLEAKDVQTLDAGAWFGEEFAGTKVPTLEEAVKEVGKAKLILNLPAMRADSKLAAHIVTALKGRAKPAEDVLVFSDSASLENFREKAQGFGYCLALDAKVEGWVILRKAEKLSLTVVRPAREQVAPELVSKAHEKKMRVYAHFADEETDMQRLIECHVDGIVTGRPERLKRVLDETKA